MKVAFGVMAVMVAAGFASAQTTTAHALAAQATSIQYTGQTAVNIGDSLVVSATVTSAGVDVTAGLPLTFTLPNGQNCTSAVTSCTISPVGALPIGTGQQPLSIAFPGTPELLASATTASVTIGQLTSVSLSTVPIGAGQYELSARLFKQPQGDLISGATVVFTFLPSTFTCTTTTDASGTALCFVTLLPGVYATTATYGGDRAFTAGSSDTAGLTVPGTVVTTVLTITPTDTTRTYGAANPVFGLTITGFVNGDTLATSGVTGSPTCSTTATAASAVGTYPITCTQGTLAAGNYSFQFAMGHLAVTPAPLQIVIGDATRAYQSANPAFTATITGLLNGDQVGVLYTTLANFASPIGTYSINGSLDPAGQGGNYSATVTPGTLTIYGTTHFVIWGGNQTSLAGAVQIGQRVTFRGPQWSRQVTGGNYTAGHSFRGWASKVTGSTWTSSPGEDPGDRDEGDTARPPETVATYISVIVATSITKNGHVINGNIAEIAVLKVDSARSDDEGDRGGDLHDSDTGVVVAIIHSTTAV